MKTISFKATDNFVKKYNDIILLEQKADTPLKKSALFDEMIDLYYAKKIMNKSTKILNEDLNIIMQDNLGLFEERMAKMLNSLYSVMDEINRKIDEK